MLISQNSEVTNSIKLFTKCNKLKIVSDDFVDQRGDGLHSSWNNHILESVRLQIVIKNPRAFTTFTLEWVANFTHII